LFIVATALFIAAVVLGAVNGTALGRWIAVVVAFACYLAVFVADWQDESDCGVASTASARSRMSARRSSGTIVHRMGGAETMAEKVLTIRCRAKVSPSCYHDRPETGSTRTAPTTTAPGARATARWSATPATSPRPAAPRRARSGRGGGAGSDPGVIDTETLAERLSAAVREIRLERAGMLPPLGIGRDEERRRVLADAVSYDALPQADRDNFRDLAEAALRVLGGRSQPTTSVKRETVPPTRAIARDIVRTIYLHVRWWALACIPRRVWRWWLVQLAIKATTEELIGPHAYAGPDGVDYERMWWAIDGELPPDRAEEIRRPAMT
jgi:hypothetical protein